MSVATPAPCRLNATAMLDRNVEAGRGGKIAFDDGSRTVTYAELLADVSRAAAVLKELGVRREERVLLVLDDTVGFPVAFLGAMRIGAVPMPVSPLDKVSNFQHFVDDSYACVVIADAPAIPDLRGGLAGRELTFVSVGGPAEGAVDLEAELEERPDFVEAAATHPDDAAFWLFSSGSTGPPKGVVHLHHDIAYTCENYAGRILGMTEDDVNFSTTNLYHAYGLGNGLSFPLHFGATSILMPGPRKPEALVATLRCRRPTLFFSVPALYSAILAAEDTDGALDSVRACVSAAEALPTTTFDRWRERFDLEIVDGIGSTEMLHIYCSNRPGEVMRGTTGRAVPGYELRLRDDDGTRIEGPGVGNLEVRGDSCAAFYWHQHEKTKRGMLGHWFFTGDRYSRDDEGFYAYEGRADDMLKIGGLWVSPVEMEDHLLAHENVVTAGVVGYSHDERSRVAAFIVRTEEGPADENLTASLQNWCKERMRRYEYPHIVRYVEELPVTANGKVQRFRLREMAGDL